MKEIFDIVDKNDRVIGQATRKECHNNANLIHRGINILILNDKGDWLLQKRTIKKDVNKGKWDISVTGHVDLGEKYEDAAKRELKEELGLVLTLKPVGKMFFNAGKESEIDMNFIAKFNGDIQDIIFNKKEVSEIKFISKKDTVKLFKERKELFAGWFKFHIKTYKDFR